MGIRATPAGRRLAMIALLLLAVVGGLIREFATNPSTLRDVGTLLLVLWLPVIGNLVAWLIRKMPRRPPPPMDFPAAAPFTPHLHAHVETLPLAAAQENAPDRAEHRCLLVVERRGFIARLRAPVAQVLDTPAQQLEFELLSPDLALRHLPPGTRFHLLAGNTPVAKGSIVAVLRR